MRAHEVFDTLFKLKGAQDRTQPDQRLVQRAAAVEQEAQLLADSDPNKEKKLENVKKMRETIRKKVVAAQNELEQHKEKLSNNLDSETHRRYLETYFNQVQGDISKPEQFAEDVVVSPRLKKAIDKYGEEFNTGVYQYLLPMAQLLEDDDGEKYTIQLTCLFGDITSALAYLKLTSDREKRAWSLHDTCLFTLPKSHYDLKTWQSLAKQYLVKKPNDLDAKIFFKALPHAAEIGPLIDQYSDKKPNSSNQRSLESEYRNLSKQLSRLKQSMLKHTIEQQEQYQEVQKELRRSLLNLVECYQGKPLSQRVPPIMLLAFRELYISQCSTELQYFLRAGYSQSHYQEVISLERATNLEKIQPLYFNSADIGYPGYYWGSTALDSDLAVLNAADLGRKTHCCQKPGGAGEEAMIYGIESENAGFEQLNRGIFEGQTTKLDDEVMSQSLVWRSQSGALVYDSAEYAKFLDVRQISGKPGLKMVKDHYIHAARLHVEQNHYHKVVIGCQYGIDPPYCVPRELCKTEHFSDDYTGYTDAALQFQTTTAINIGLYSIFCDSDSVSPGRNIIAKNTTPMPLTGSQGHEALLIAMYYDLADAIEFLHNLGNQITAGDLNYNIGEDSILSMAMKRYDYKLAQFLLSAGALFDKSNILDCILGLSTLAAREKMNLLLTMMESDCKKVLKILDEQDISYDLVTYACNDGRQLIRWVNFIGADKVTLNVAAILAISREDISEATKLLTTIDTPKKDHFIATILTTSWEETTDQVVEHSVKLIAIMTDVNSRFRLKRTAGTLLDHVINSKTLKQAEKIAITNQLFHYGAQLQQRILTKASSPLVTAIRSSEYDLAIALSKHLQQTQDAATAQQIFSDVLQEINERISPGSNPYSSLIRSHKPIPSSDIKLCLQVLSTLIQNGADACQALASVLNQAVQHPELVDVAVLLSKHIDDPYTPIRATKGYLPIQTTPITYTIDLLLETRPDNDILTNLIPILDVLLTKETTANTEDSVLFQLAQCKTDQQASAILLLRKLREHDTKLMQVGKYGETTLMHAISCNNFELATELLPYTDINTQDNDHDTALHLALDKFRSGPLRIQAGMMALALIDKGAHIDIIGRYSDTALSMAQVSSLEELKQKIIYTVYFNACELGKFDLIKKIISRNEFDPNLQISDSYTLLQRALFYPEPIQSNLIELLLEAGANPEIENRFQENALLLSESLQRVSSNSKELLTQAEMKKPNCHQFFTRKTKHQQQSKQLLKLVSSDNVAKLGEFMRQNKIEPDSYFTDQYGIRLTLLMKACETGAVNVAQYLISKHADVHATDPENKTTFDYVHKCKDRIIRSQLYTLLHVGPSKARSHKT